MTISTFQSSDDRVAHTGTLLFSRIQTVFYKSVPKEFKKSLTRLLGLKGGLVSIFIFLGTPDGYTLDIKQTCRQT